jgi:heterotetrameric sarcosine oxidase gamma subunit
VSALAFMSPDADSEAVLARTPMERRARGAGARLEPRGGWSVAVDFGDAERERRRLGETVGFADRSSLVKLELQADPATLASVVGAAADGVELNPGTASLVDGVWWCPVTPARVVALAESAGAAGLRAAISGAVAQAGGQGEATITVLDLTSALAGLTLAGPGANELLARFCAIDVRASVMPVAAFRPGSVARTPGYVLREREDRLLVLVGWALGEYLWDVVADAAEHLGGGPVGADALRERADA